MRRAPIVLTATVLGTAGVLLFKPLAPSALTGAEVAEGTSTGSTAASSGTAASEAGDGTASSGAGTSTGSGSSSSTSSGSSSGGSSSSGSSAAKDGTYTGDAETTRFGTTQVSVTVAGGRITEVATLQLNQADPRSTQISESAAPTLRSEVLAQQTAAVDTVSGATWTSAAYEASLQSALDRAGFTAADGSTASEDLSNLQESGGGFGH